MDYQTIELSSWSRKAQYLLFRDYQQPHFSLTTRVDVTSLLNQTTADNLSSYRACMYAIGCGVDAVPELKSRFNETEIRQYECFDLSMTVPRSDNSFAFGHVPFNASFSCFDAVCEQEIEQARNTSAGNSALSNTRNRNNHSSRYSDAVVYLSCMPWLDFSSITNAMPNPEDCIPRVAWGKYISGPDSTWSMAMAIQVHHALVDGYHVGQFFSCVQDVMNSSLSS